jgi:uncharacterized repeat protein (TIGR01451 family)
LTESQSFKYAHGSTQEKTLGEVERYSLYLEDMPEAKGGLESLLARAKDQEILYDWSGAAETYGSAVSIIPESDPQRIAVILERKAYANYKAALQAADIDEFNRMADTTTGQYAKAKEACEKAGGPESKARMNRCDGMLAFLGFIRAKDAVERKKQANDSWEHGMESLDGFAAAGNGLEFCKTFNELCLSAVFASHFTPDFESRKKRMTEGLKYGEKAVAFTASLNDSSVAVRTLVLASSFWERVGFCGMGREDSHSCHRKAIDCWQRAESLSKEAVLNAMPLAWIVGDAPFDPNRDANNELRAFERSIEVVRKSGDRLLIGHALAGLSFYAIWIHDVPEDKERSESLLRQGLDYAIEAGNEFSKIGFIAVTHPMMWVMFPFAEYYASSAFFEKDLKKKRVLAEKALEAYPECDRLGKLSGYTWRVLCADAGLGTAYCELARAEADIDRKRTLLENAVHHSKKFIDLLEIWDAGTLYNLGSNHQILADVQAEFAETMADSDNKTRALREATELGEKAIAEFTSGMAAVSMTEDASSISGLGWAWTRLGKRYYALSRIVSDGKLLSRSAECFESSADAYLKAGQSARAAESLWEAARVRDSVGDHSKSSELFMLASREYTKAAEGIPPLKEIYSDHSAYMNAWSEIERARYHHARQEYGESKKHYESASKLHESTSRWKHLSPNYLAWAEIENGEDLSRREKSEEGIEAFGKAADLFSRTKVLLKTHKDKLEDQDELKNLEKLANAADLRREYCIGRVALEEAKLLDRQGDEFASCEKFGCAEAAFKKVHTSLESDEDKREIQLIMILSKAWQMMAKAEAEASPELYNGASRLFEEAKELSIGEKAKLLALGHSRFCKALEAGTKFGDTGDTALHAIASQNLESAAKSYLKAGLESDAEYAKGSKLLFDAYVYMNKANKEEDTTKKAKLYALTEKVLEASANSFAKSNYVKKKEEVTKLLQRVKEDRELAVSLMEVFHAPDVISSTMSFAAPSQTQETAVGVEKFRDASIQATMMAKPKELKVGDDLNLEIELVNAGRAPAQLIKLQDLLPKGFTLLEEPGGYRMEDSYLNLRGKRLDPLKTEEIKLVLRPTHRGQFVLKPRVLYLDDSGKYKSHEPEPMSVTVGAEPTVLSDKAAHVDTREAAEARSLLAGLNVVTLSHYRIVGNYVRYGGAVCSALKDARQKIVSACRSSSPKRENYIIWAPSGSGKTYFVQEVAALLGDSVHYSELNLAKLDEAGFRSGLAELRGVHGPSLCLVDEADAKPDEPWPYEALMPFLDASATEGARFVFVLTGSSGSSLEEMKKTIASRPKGSDILSRVPTDNEYSIPSMGVGDRLLVVLSQFRLAGKQMGHDVREVEKLGLYYVALNPRLSNARQLREFAVRCAERVLPSDDRLKYDSLFRPGDLENKLFWTQALQSASALVDSFLLVED